MVASLCSDGRTCRLVLRRFDVKRVMVRTWKSAFYCGGVFFWCRRCCDAYTTLHTFALQHANLLGTPTVAVSDPNPS